MKKTTSNRLLRLGFAGSLTVILAVAWLSYQSIRQMARRADWVRHTMEVVAQDERVRTSLRSLESAQRGFLLTGELGSADRIEDVADQLRSSIEALGQLTGDNPGQQERVAKLRDAAEKRIKFAEGLVMIRQQIGDAAAITQFQNGEGLRFSREADALVSVVRKEEERLLNERQNSVNLTQQRTADLLALLSACTVVLLTLKFVFIERRLRVMQITNQEMSFLRHFVEELQICSSTTDALKSIEHQLQRLLGADCCGQTSLINPSRDIVETLVAWGDDSLREDIFRPDACCALRKGSPYLLLNPADGLSCAHLGKRVNKSYIAFPLSAYGETIGVVHLFFEEMKSARIWAEGEHQNFLIEVMEQVALTLAGLRLREALQAQSIKDPLTGTFNRRYMESTLDRELLRARRKGSQVGLILVDLDHFKKLNDSYGHQAGDEVLKSAAQVFSRVVRAEDIVCRYGGEEFAIILPDIAHETVCARAESIREAIQNLHVEYNGSLVGPISLSAGVALSAADVYRASELIRNADTQLYRAKRLGRNRVESAVEASGTAEESVAAK
jgi:diguanylate cyclase (GGDEF)-like protein